MRNVLKLLATGTNDALLKFELETAMFANFFEQRKQTVYFALGGEHLEGILASANAHGVTIQRVDGAGEHETYAMLHQGDLQGWSPAPPSAGQGPAAPIGTTGAGSRRPDPQATGSDETQSAPPK